MRFLERPSKPGFGAGRGIAMLNAAFTMAVMEFHVKGSNDMLGMHAKLAELSRTGRDVPVFRPWKTETIN